MPVLEDIRKVRRLKNTVVVRLYGKNKDRYIFIERVGCERKMVVIIQNMERPSVISSIISMCLLR